MWYSKSQIRRGRAVPLSDPPLTTQQVATPTHSTNQSHKPKRTERKNISAQIQTVKIPTTQLKKTLTDRLAKWGASFSEKSIEREHFCHRQTPLKTSTQNVLQIQRRFQWTSIN